MLRLQNMPDRLEIASKEWGLHKAIEIVFLDETKAELRDGRTGFHLSIEHEEGLSDGGRQPTPEILRVLTDLGFTDDLPDPELRRRQRPFRNQMQSELRNEILRDFLRFAGTNVPFYRDNQRYRLADIEDVEGLRTLPVLNKAALRENFNSLLADSVDIPEGLASGRLRIARTSGTTDERVQVISDTTIDQVPPDYEEVWGLDFSGRTPRTAILTTPLCSATECHLGKLPLEQRVHHGIVLYLNSTEDLFSAPEALIRNIAEELWAFRPEILLVNPYYLMWFGREAQRLGLDLPKIELILTSYQYASKIHKRALATLFGAPVYDTYSATELGGCRLGVECKNGHWHVYEDHAIIEIMDENGISSPDGIGSVVTTVVAGRLMPLIRYEVGDIARLADIDCNCALSDWQCLEFHGRRKDVLHLGGRMFTTREIDDILAEIADVDFYRCTQTGDAALTIDVVPAPGTAVRRDEIERLVRARLPVNDVIIRPAQRLDPEPSMKFRLTARA